MEEELLVSITQLELATILAKEPNEREATLEVVRKVAVSISFLLDVESINNQKAVLLLVEQLGSVLAILTQLVAVAAMERVLYMEVLMVVPEVQAQLNMQLTQGIRMTEIEVLPLVAQVIRAQESVIVMSSMLTVVGIAKQMEVGAVPPEDLIKQRQLPSLQTNMLLKASEHLQVKAGLQLKDLVLDSSTAEVFTVTWSDCIEQSSTKLFVQRRNSHEVAVIEQCVLPGREKVVFERVLLEVELYTSRKQEAKGAEGEEESQLVPQRAQRREGREEWQVAARSRKESEERTGWLEGSRVSCMSMRQTIENSK